MLKIELLCFILQDYSGVYKMLLQELAQKRGLSLPKYTTTNYGEGHMPTFSSKVEIKGELFQGDVAKTKKQAENNAAKFALSQLEECKLVVVVQGDDSTFCRSLFNGSVIHFYITCCRFIGLSLKSWSVL